ncbi:TBC1 domain family member 4 [Frankliniella fusca]|uniref:TBC1 domain family member 4 n=1 Tax=Frankliniella fusca TaxID=407009 RepID=A0AAE1HGP9_9NEOP|nr:TBC1 domain family member 4 [Frankliniella fusca]
MVMELFTQMREQIRDGSPHPGGSGAGSGAGALRDGQGAAGSPGSPSGAYHQAYHQPQGPGRSLSSAANLTSLCADISPSSSHFFEVLYIGKIKVSHRKVPESFIDDALEKFRLHDLEKERGRLVENAGKALLLRNNSSSRILVGAGPAGPPAAGLALASERRGSQDSTYGGSDLGSAENISHNPGLAPAGGPGSGPPAPPGSVPAIALSGSVETLAPAAPAPTPAAGAEDQDPVEQQVAVPKSSTADDGWGKQNSLPLEAMRTRAGSAGSALMKKPDIGGSGSTSNVEHNRTMLFLVGRSDLRLISPDRKQILLHKNLRDIASCIQGVKNSEHFGFICREQNAENFIGYVFKCQSESFADDVVGAITQAFQATSEAYKKEKQPVLSCEHCPMVWFHKLCSELEGVSDRRAQQIIFRRLEQLPEEEQGILLTKFQGSENSSHTKGQREQNEFLMMLIRAHCESKQARHVHDTAENRSEFLNQYLGGSTIFMKAKRSLTSSFDHLLKRRGSRDDFNPMAKEHSLPINATLCKENSLGKGSSPLANGAPALELPPDHEEDANDPQRPRSSTIGSLTGEAIKKELGPGGSLSGGSSQPQLSAVPGSPGSPQQKGSQMMNIFLKVGNTPKSSSMSSDSPEDVRRHSGSWRQAIFKTVVTPSKSLPGDGVEAKEIPAKKTKEELRALWKKAINQQVLLIRMEKENARLRARQEEATVKRIKLEYDEIGSCMREVMEVWDLLISKESRVSARCDNQMLLQAIRQGVPRSKRGDVWHFLAEQYCLKIPPIDTTNFPNYNVPYEDLLKQLTSHQHAILIDLGRTFPNHTYFSSPLGPGQLALFNLLKAYSLLDPEVGYCQGLSFVAGVLLLHMSEDIAFFLLRHLMFRRGLRRQYLPDMAALQVQLYQLSRLLHDQQPALYAHLDKHEVAPTLYAAPWMLTLFASQFPLGFVTRVFDLMFVESPEVIFRVAIALLSEHKDGILSCDSFEEIMDYLKTKIPNIDKNQLDRIMKKVFNMDVTKQLHEYEVEYHVLQEEMSSPRPEAEKLRQLTIENNQLKEQLEISSSNMHRLETSRTLQQAQLNRLESQVRSLEVSISTLGGFISTLIENHKDIEIPGDVRRLVAQLSAPGPDRRKNSGNLGLGNILKPRHDPPNTIKPEPKPDSKLTLNINRNEAMARTKSDPPRMVPTPRSFRLNVIEDDDRYESNLRPTMSLQNGSTINSMNSKFNNAGKPYPLKSALSSPNLSAKMSSFFQAGRQQQSEQRLNSLNKGQNELDKLLEGHVSSNNSSRDTRGLSPGKNLNSEGSFVDIPLNEGNSEKLSVNDHGASKENQQPVRRGDIMKQLQSIQKHDSLPDSSSQSLQSLSLGAEVVKEHSEQVTVGDSTDSLQQTPTLHPLDTCSDVSFSYGGTTKLKTIRPLRAQLGRNATIGTFSPSSLPQPVSPTPSSPEMTAATSASSEPLKGLVTPKKELLSS